jgi:dihydroflavonol-4-reductase
MREAFGEHFSKLELVSANLLDANSLDKAIQGANYVVHTASPFTFSAKTEEDLVKPAVEGTLAIMEACKKHNVKRVVITSSIAAVFMGWKRADGRPKAWNEQFWSKEENMNS